MNIDYVKHVTPTQAFPPSIKRDMMLKTEDISCKYTETSSQWQEFDILFFAKCFRDGFLPIKNYHDQNVEIWRRNVQSHELTFLLATRDATSHAQT